MQGETERLHTTAHSGASSMNTSDLHSGMQMHTQEMQHRELSDVRGHDHFSDPRSQSTVSVGGLARLWLDSWEVEAPVLRAGLEMEQGPCEEVFLW